jgi:murein DD-endopeptidase MepM/ murein hydrolase activator NlpD
MEKSVEEQETTSSQPSAGWQIWASWIGTAVLVALLVSVLYWQPIVAQELDEMTAQGDTIIVDPVAEVSNDALVNMPHFEVLMENRFVEREPATHTIAPTRPRSEPISYEVASGDAVFSIAQKYNITPETLLWSNYDVLKDDPHSLTVGQVLTIPPTNGILYEWQEGDTLEAVASSFKASADDILNWSGNRLDITDPKIEPGEVVMIPGGEREFQQWVVPTIPVGRAGVATSIPGACETSDGGSYGSGFFVWPAANRYLSGNDYWSGHLAIDIAAGTGAPIYAADGGVVVYAGWMSGGYGNMIMIDHRNGYHTLYAHLSVVNVSCGSSVGQGQMIGNAGSTGNSTGPHLHFEVRYLGGFLNPWTVLP